CGRGVTSLRSVTLIPAAASARTALSRPAPGPVTKTVQVRMPASIARLPASSAATWAADGVLFREPLNPFAPEVDQETTSPLTSVNVMIVLLNVALMCATPVGMLRLIFFFLIGAFMSYCFLLAQRFNYLPGAFFL